MLTDFWRDVIALFGFALTTAGLIYAIVQIRKTKSAAGAAEEAAKKSLTESRLSFQRYAASNAHRFINEARIHLERKEWEKAAGRISDVADQAGQLALMDPEWHEFAQQLRIWAGTCRRLSSGELARFLKGKWESFSVRLQTKIDSWHGPFRDVSQEELHDS